MPQLASYFNSLRGSLILPVNALFLLQWLAPNFRQVSFASWLQTRQWSSNIGDRI